ncbi:hypothetical protein N9Z53_04690, partial [Mariniblastus sp.]|nr:hypothetical protein [Mariniblastus sp.]
MKLISHTSATPISKATPSPNLKSVFMETEEELDLERIREFVRCFEGVTDLQFHAVPYDLDTDEAAGYLLLVASINQQSPAEFIRDFVLELHTELGDDLLKFKTLPKIQREDAVKRQESWINSRDMRGWKLTPHLLRILTEASNIYCKTKSQGGLIAYGRQKGDVVIAADQLARSIHYFGKDPLGAR